MVLRFDKKEIQSTKNNRHIEREVTANYCCTIRGCRFVSNAFQILMIFWLRDSVCVSISANRLSLRQSLFVTTAIPFELFLYWRLSHIEIISLNFRVLRFMLSRTKIICCISCISKCPLRLLFILSFCWNWMRQLVSVEFWTSFSIWKSKVFKIKFIASFALT